MVHSVIHKHNGFIEVESEIGVGTTFHITLPASRKELMVEDGESKEIVEGMGRVLLMDDQEVILEVNREILTRLGYEVECSRDGLEAIEKYKDKMRAGRPFDVVIMDLTVPGGMGGREATRRLREIDPFSRVIVSNGYSDDPVMANCRDYGFKAIIPKSYTIDEMSQVLAQVIEEGHHHPNR